MASLVVPSHVPSVAEDVEQLRKAFEGILDFFFFLLIVMIYLNMFFFGCEILLCFNFLIIDFWSGSLDCSFLFYSKEIFTFLWLIIQ